MKMKRLNMKIDDCKKTTEPTIMTELKQLQEDIIKTQEQQSNLTNTPLWAFKTLLSILIKYHFKSSYENENNRY